MAAMPDDFWSEYDRRRATNHVALMLAARAAVAEIERNDVAREETRRRLQACLDEYDAVARLLRDRVTASRQLEVIDSFLARIGG